MIINYTPDVSSGSGGYLDLAVAFVIAAVRGVVPPFGGAVARFRPRWRRHRRL